MMRRRTIGWMALVFTEPRYMHQVAKKNRWRSKLYNQMTAMTRRKMMMEQN